MKTSELIDEAVSLPPAEATDATWLEAARRRLAELRSGAVVEVESEQIFVRICDRYAFARK